MGSLWGHFGVAVGSLWGLFGATLGPLWGHFGVTLGSLLGGFGATSGTLWGHFGVAFGALRGHLRGKFLGVVFHKIVISEKNQKPPNDNFTHTAKRQLISNKTVCKNAHILNDARKSQRVRTRREFGPNSEVLAAKRLCSWVGGNFRPGPTRPSPTRPDPTRPPATHD